MFRSKKLLVGGTFAYLTATTFTYLYFKSRNKPAKGGSSPNTYDNIATKYDAAVDFDEVS